MGAKIISVSPDNVTYYVMPGNAGEISREGAAIDDTIFGQTFRSSITGIIGWSIGANAVYKGYPGYATKIKAVGTSTVITDEATTFVSGKTYQITDTAKRILNRAVTIVVEDNSVDHTADVDNIDFLFGKVTFKSTYTVTGPVTVTGAYFPTVDAGHAQSYTLTQSADAIDTTDFPAASSNGGLKTFTPGLRQVSLELPTVYTAIDDWAADLIARNEVILEVNPDGLGKSLARGFFRLVTTRQSGNVGALEEETLSFQLSVPLQSSGPSLAIPFGWSHAVDSPIPTAVKHTLDAWQNQALLYAKYLPDGAVGVRGQGVVTNFTLTGGMESMNSFAFTLQGSGALVAV